MRILKISSVIILLYIISLVIGLEFNIKKLDISFATYYILYVFVALLCLVGFYKLDDVLKERKYKPVIAFLLRCCLVLLLGTFIIIAGNYVNSVLLISAHVLTIKGLIVFPIGYIVNYTFFFHENEVQE